MEREHLVIALYPSLWEVWEASPQEAFLWQSYLRLPRDSREQEIRSAITLRCTLLRKEGYE